MKIYTIGILGSVSKSSEDIRDIEKRINEIVLKDKKQKYKMYSTKTERC